MSKITDTVWALAEPVVRKNGCEVWDVEYVKEAGQWFLRLFIDKAEGGVFISDCETISRELDTILDEADPIPESYVFEVSSAGAERQLKRPGDFARFIGADVEVKLYKPVNGSKAYFGKLRGYESGGVTIETDVDTYTFEKAQVASVRLRIL
ncbi:MAG: ribosome maturation factor RimP [Oscillospiraceae bacterium]